jgi:hypothetical protein
MNSDVDIGTLPLSEWQFSVRHICLQYRNKLNNRCQCWISDIADIKIDDDAHLYTGRIWLYLYIKIITDVCKTASMSYCGASTCGTCRQPWTPWCSSLPRWVSSPAMCDLKTEQSIQFVLTLNDCLFGTRMTEYWTERSAEYWIIMVTKNKHHLTAPSWQDWRTAFNSVKRWANDTHLCIWVFLLNSLNNLILGGKISLVLTMNLEALLSS